MTKKLTIAIDGPAGAGKSTVAQIVAQRLGYTYIDTGAMYRTVTLAALETGVDITDEAALVKLAANINIRLEGQRGENKPRVFLNGRDVTQEIRTPEISRHVSIVAQVAGVREKMVQLQQQMGETGGVVMDGRDIGTHVLPSAEIKVFLTASAEERAQRRGKELTEKGFSIDMNSLRKEMYDRDRMDCEREVAPLVQAPDAVLLDSTKLHIDGVVEKILALTKEK